MSYDNNWINNDYGHKLPFTSNIIENFQFRAEFDPKTEYDHPLSFAGRAICLFNGLATVVAGVVAPFFKAHEFFTLDEDDPNRCIWQSKTWQVVDFAAAMGTILACSCLKVGCSALGIIHPFFGIRCEE